MTISQLSMDMEWNAQTSSAEGSLVKISLMPENEKALQAKSRLFGKRCSVSFAKYDRVMCSWRMSQHSLIEDYQLYLGTWPKQGTMQNGHVYERQTLVRHINEKEYSLWPTPTAIDAGSGRINKSMSSNAKERPTLALMARKSLWPTPTANDAKNATLPPAAMNRDSLPGELRRQMWRTPQAHDAKSSRVQSGHATDLTHQVAERLNPVWVECLMGLPEGWTDIEDTSTNGQLGQESNNMTGNHQE
jgi:hypothetical protein